ncbi:uncharacterized protein LOC121926955 [Sceloporus undulatus]|uniref:uncharacterized protein LOC121926955 n=1 Tax=Sceloporus undulatus TaxID=8520 RepID=UPI001C4D7771|nr:uncharacterized protein LOC121926955 [Sceloporus undulatus]
MFWVVRGLLHSALQEENKDNSTAHCEEFARHSIHSDLDAVVDSPVDVILAPTCPVLLDKFQSVQPDDVGRIPGEVRATMYILDPFSSWALKTARGGLAEWVCRRGEREYAGVSTSYHYSDRHLIRIGNGGWWRGKKSFRLPTKSCPFTTLNCHKIAIEFCTGKHSTTEGEQLIVDFCVTNCISWGDNRNGTMSMSCNELQQKAP